MTAPTEALKLARDFLIHLGEGRWGDRVYVLGAVHDALDSLEQAQALPDQDINDVMESCLNDWDWRAFARAIERKIRG